MQSFVFRRAGVHFGEDVVLLVLAVRSALSALNDAVANEEHTDHETHDKNAADQVRQSSHERTSLRWPSDGRLRTTSIQIIVVDDGSQRNVEYIREFAVRLITSVVNLIGFRRTAAIIVIVVVVLVFILITDFVSVEILVVLVGLVCR